jgi:hypothetical protein
VAEDTAPVAEAVVQAVAAVRVGAAERMVAEACGMQARPQVEEPAGEAALRAAVDPEAVVPVVAVEREVRAVALEAEPGQESVAQVAAVMGRAPAVEEQAVLVAVIMDLAAVALVVEAERVVPVEVAAQAPAGAEDLGAAEQVPVEEQADRRNPENG